MKATTKKNALTWLKEGGIYVVLLVLLAIIIFQDPSFLSLMNLSNILTQSSVRIIIALGVAGLFLWRGTELFARRRGGVGGSPGPGRPPQGGAREHYRGCGFTYAHRHLPFARGP